MGMVSLPLTRTAGFLPLLCLELFDCTLNLGLFDFFCDFTITRFPPLVAPALASEPLYESKSEEEEIKDVAESLSADEEEEAWHQPSWRQPSCSCPISYYG